MTLPDQYDDTPADHIPVNATGLLVIVCTYNEFENLPRLVDELFCHLPGCHILVVDDNSPDGTGAWAERSATERDGMFCLTRPGKQGLGSATIAGLSWGHEREYRWLATIDADFSHDPASMPLLFRELQRDDSGRTVVIGSRYVTGGRTSGWPIGRRIASRFVNRFSRLVLGLPVHDCTGAMRIYPARELQEMKLESIHSTGYDYLEEMLFRLHRRGTKFVEVPIHFRDRAAGRSKANWREGLAAIFRIVRLRFGG
jgi:dolichol-phosphate mannosyltransferase